MGWLKTFSERFARPAASPIEQDVIARLLPFWQAAIPLPQPHDYRAFAQDGFRRNTIIFSCITEIATSAAEPVLQAMRTTTQGADLLPPTDPLSWLIAHPNPEQSMYEVLSTMATHLHVAGNAYLHKVRARNGQPAQLWLLRPDRVTVQPDRTGMVAQYAFAVNGQPIMLPAADVVHFKMHPDPLDDYYGLSPIAVLARFGDLDNQASDFLRAFFLNAGVPGGLLKFKAGRVGKDERERVRQLWVDQFSTEKGWHAPGVIDADVDYQELGTQPRRMDLSTIWSVTESRMCSVFGVPPILIGAWVGLEHATMANYAEARRSFWEETLSPFYRRLIDTLNMGLASEFGADRLLQFDFGAVAALQEDRNVTEERALKAWDAGLVTMNQAAVALGYPETPDGNVRKLSTINTLIPVSGTATQARLHAEALSISLSRPRERQARFVDTPAEDPFYLAVHKIADRLTPDMRDAFLRGVLAMNGAIDENALIAAVEAGDFQRAVAAIPFEVFADALKTGGGEVLLDVLAQSGTAAAATLADTHGLTITFDLTNPRAQAYAATQTADLVTEVTDATKEAIRVLIERGFAEGIPPRQLAQEIKQIIGLTSRQADAVSNFQASLLADGVTGDILDARVGKYEEAQLRYRATMIARTETLASSNQGQLETWMQAREKGLLLADQKRIFITTPDDRLDPECEVLDGEEVGLDEPFSFGGMNPPIHPNCRCCVALSMPQ